MYHFATNAELKTLAREAATANPHIAPLLEELAFRLRTTQPLVSTFKPTSPAPHGWTVEPDYGVGDFAGEWNDYPVYKDWHEAAISACELYIELMRDPSVSRLGGVTILPMREEDLDAQNTYETKA